MSPIVDAKSVDVVDAKSVNVVDAKSVNVINAMSVDVEGVDVVDAKSVNVVDAKSADVVNAKSVDVINAMSVDVEDYFQVSAFERVVTRAQWDGFESRVVKNTNALLDLFQHHGVRATFFILGWVATRYPSLVRKIAGRGHEVASHGYHHELVYSLTPAQFREDVRRAKGVIEDAAGCRVSGYRAPSFTVTIASMWALDVLIEEGYAYDASIFPIHHDRYGIPDAPRFPHAIDRAAGTIVEVPGSTVRVAGTNLPVAGGGYFRLLPYAWTRWGIRHVNTHDHQPVTFYLHPWEIDPEQPRFAVSRTTALRHYTGLGATRARLGRLLTEFRFDSIASMLALPSAAPRSHAPGLAYAR